MAQVTVVEIPSMSGGKNSKGKKLIHICRVRKVGKGLSVDCSCRGFRRWHHCKHVAIAKAKV